MMVDLTFWQQGLINLSGAIPGLVCGFILGRRDRDRPIANLDRQIVDMAEAINDMQDELDARSRTITDLRAALETAEDRFRLLVVLKDQANDELSSGLERAKGQLAHQAEALEEAKGFWETILQNTDTILTLTAERDQAIRLLAESAKVVCGLQTALDEMSKNFEHDISAANDEVAALTAERDRANAGSERAWDRADQFSRERTSLMHEVATLTAERDALRDRHQEQPA